MNRLYTVLGATGLLAACAVMWFLWEEGQVENAAKSSPVEQLMRELTDPSLTKRQHAESKILAMGEAALPALRRAASDEDAGLAARARNLADRIEFPKLCPRYIDQLMSPESEAEGQTAEAWITEHLQDAVPYLVERISPPAPGTPSRGPMVFIFRAWRGDLMTDAQKTSFVRKAFAVRWEIPPDEKQRADLVVDGVANSESRASLRERESSPWDFLQPHFVVNLDGKPLKDGEIFSGSTKYIFLPDLGPGEHELVVNLQFREREGTWSTVLQASEKINVVATAR